MRVMTRTAGSRYGMRGILICGGMIGRVSIFADFAYTGKNTSTKRIVPISIKEPNSPKSRMACASSHTRQKKAATVVMFPISKGGAISLNASLRLVTSRI